MKKSKNIMHVVCSLECGGLEKVVISFANRLDKKRFNNTICCLDSIGELAEEVNEGIKVILAGRKVKRFDYSLIFKLAQIFKKEKVGLVHTHNMGPLIYGTLAARLAGVPIVINTRHGRANKKCNRVIWGMNDAIITISEDARREILKWNHINEEKVRVIYNGIEINKFHFSNKQCSVIEIRKELNLQKDTYIIGIVARLAIEKDHKTLIKAFRNIVNSNINAELVIVGGGSCERDLKNIAKKENIMGRVKFLGFRDNIPKILTIFDVFVLSSVMEGISITLLEAMAAGKPVVATNVGGNPEVIVDGVTGFLVPPKKPDEMALSIIKILQESKLAKKMVDAGRKRVEEKFSLDRMVNEYMGIYKEILAKKKIK